MDASTRCYRALLVMYARSFRREFGTDLVAVFNDLRRDRGAWQAWRRCLGDAARAAPRSRAEAIAEFRPSARVAEVAGVAVSGVVLINYGGVLGAMAVFAGLASTLATVCMRVPFRSSGRRDSYGY